MNNYKWILLLSFSCLYIVINAQTETELDSTLRNINLDDVVVTAQYAPTASENAVHQIKVIRAIDIQEQGLNNLAEVLANQLNLRVSTDPILGNGLRIQGIGGENIQVMIDGVPIIGRVNGNIDLAQINLQNVQRIEIVEGAMSAQYGSNASGGVVNIITKKSQLQKFQIQSQNQYESIGIYNNSLTVGTQFGKTFLSVTGYRNQSQFVEKDSLRLFEEVELANGTTTQTKVNPWNPKTQHGLDGTLRYRLNDSTTITYQYRLFDEKLFSYGGIRRPQFRPYAFDEFYTTVRQDHSLNVESYLNKNFYLNSTTAFNQFAREKETQRLDVEADTTSLVDNGQDTTSFTSFLHRSILSTTTDRRLNGQIGFEILHETGTGKRIVDTTSSPINEAQIFNYALWASLNYKYSKTLTIQGNLRYGHNTKYDHPLIPSLHLSWKPRKDWNFQLSYAHGFRSPSLKELHFNFIDINHYIVGNTELKAENSKNTSLTIQHNKNIFTNHQFSFTGKLFYNSIKNRIIIAEFAPFQFNYQNLENFETHGMNLQVEYNFGKKIMLKSGLAYTRLFNFWSTDFETDKFTGLYEMQNELSYLIPKINARLVLTHRFIGKQVRFYQNDEDVLEEGFIGDYHIINASVSRNFWKKRIFVSLGIKNLLDTQSVPFVGQGDGPHSSVGNSQLLNWGRTYFIRLNLKF
jgi:outer membrane receptor for ferrienterochelin and colicins